ncbi:MAG: DUF2339 domain-containing protein [Phycisphaerales bacterium]|nr:DUF2339 domain-containing protein [Phycisphaerales bacterium]
MPFDSKEILARLDALHRRVAALEHRLAKLTESPAQAQSLEAPRPTPEPPRTVDPPPTDLPPAAIETAPRPDAAAARAAHKRAALERAFTKPPEPATSAPFSVERLVGGRVFGVVGAFVIVIGVALGLKLAWDEGWLDLIPNNFKCIISALFGFTLLGAGELARRKWGAIASIGCSVAGIGVIYAASYAAYGAFQLVPHEVGFVLLAASAALGVVVGARAKLASVAALSLVAGYAVPLFFLNVEQSPIVLPTYLLALLTCGLALSAWRGGRFQFLRTLCWWFTIFFGAAAALAAIKTPYISLTFLAAAWFLVHAELTASASKSRLTPMRLSLEAKNALAWRAMRPLMCSFGTTAWATFLAAVTLDHAGYIVWHAPAAAFFITALAALTFGSHMRVLRDAPTTDLERLAAIFVMQAGALLISAIALALTGQLEVVAWLAMGVAAALAGKWMRARALVYYGMIVLAIATTRLVTYDWLFSAINAKGYNLGGLVFTTWTGLAAITGCCWITVALVLRETTNAGRRALAIFAASLGVALCFGSLLHNDVIVLALSIAWLFMSFILFGAGLLLRGVALDRLALAGTALAAGAWALAHPFSSWASSDAALLAHPGLWHALFIVAGAAVMASVLIRRRIEADAIVAAIAFCFAGLLALASTSLEVARVAEVMTDEQTSRRAAVSIWWGLCAVALLVTGFWRRWAPVRHVGLGLLALATAKAVVFDLQGVDQAWRVGSFLSLGLLMLGVGLAYARLSARIALSGRSPTGDPREEFLHTITTPAEYDHRSI